MNGTARAGQLVPGARVDRYEVLKLLGSGGMAEVWLVRHETLGGLFALKLLTTTSPSIRDRLLQEGRVQSGLRHTNVVPVLDVVDVGGQPALVLAYVAGPSLDAVLRRIRLDGPQVDHIARGVLRGVAAAHRGGFVHRDLKPDNVLLALEDGQIVPKVADFGLVKALHAEDSGGVQTRAGAGFGTPFYMAPEQWRDSSVVGPQADVYSLGVVLYQLLMGRLPYEDSDPLTLGPRILAGDRPPLVGVPLPIARLVDAALDPDPDRRPADAGALFAAWAAVSAELAPSWPPTVLALFDQEHPASAPRTGTWTGDTAAPETFADLSLASTASDPTASLPSPPSLSPGEPANAPGPPRRRLIGAAFSLVSAVAGAGALAALALTAWPPSPPEQALDLVWLGAEPTIVEAPAELVGRRPTWALDWKDGLLVAARRLNARGGLDANNALDGVRRIDLRFDRDDQGRIVQVVSRQPGLPDHHIALTWGDGHMVRRHLSPMGHPQASAEGAGGPSDQPINVFVEDHTLDDQGRTVEIRWLDPDGQPMVAQDGSFGHRLTRDDLGRVITVELLDADGRRAQALGGTVSFAYGYEDPRFPFTVTSVETQGLSGAPLAAADGWSRVETRHDDLGLVAERRWLDDRGRAVVNRDTGCYSLVFEDRPDHFDQRCLGPDGLPQDNREGWARLAVTLDPNGYPSEHSWFDKDDHPAPGSGAAARLTHQYNPSGIMLQEGPGYDVEGHPVPLAGTTAIAWRYRLDAKGLVEEQANLDADLQPVVHDKGYAFGRLTLDADGQPTVIDRFGARGEPVLNRDGYFRNEKRYDGGFLVEESYFDVVSKPVAPNGTHRAVFKRDVQGRSVTEAHFGIHGEAAYNPYRRFHRREVQRDAFGNVTEQRLWGDDQERLLNAEDVYLTARTWDRTGLLAEERWLDDHDQPMLREGWGASARYLYDDKARPTRIDYRGIDGQPMTPGCAVEERRYDDAAGSMERRCYSADGRPASLPDEPCLQKLVAKDLLDRVTLERCEPSDPNLPVLETRRRFEGALGAPIETSFFGESGVPIRHPDWAWHRMVVVYGILGKPTDERWFDVDGRPLWVPDCYSAHTTKLRDAQGHLILQSYFDENDQPPKTGMATMENRSLDGVHLTDTWIRDAQGALVMGPHQYAHRHIDYKPDSTVRQVLMFDPSGRPVEVGWGEGERW